MAPPWWSKRPDVRGRRLIHGPDSAWDAFAGAFIKVALGTGVPLTVGILIQVRLWTDLGVMAAIVLGFSIGGGIVTGLLCAAPVLLQNWAWGRLTDGTPIDDDQE